MINNKPVVSTTSMRVSEATKEKLKQLRRRRESADETLNRILTAILEYNGPEDALVDQITSVKIYTSTKRKLASLMLPEETFDEALCRVVSKIKSEVD
jgi:esterase/lipase